MKICAIICEFNPFHNGHAYLIRRAKELSGCNAVIGVMSGGFTQRGEMSVLDKFVRARHAISGGMDAVIELPSPFAVAPAEIFARGAVKIISSVPQITHLAFGCESNCEDGGVFERAAEILLNESKEFKEALFKSLDGGESFVRSRVAAFSACGGNGELISSPNDILGVEYTRAIISSGAGVEILPIRRVGAGYKDESLDKEYASSAALRANGDSSQLADFMPEYALRDFIQRVDRSERFGQMAADYLFTCDKNDLKRVYGCSEGLENLLKKLAEGNSYESIIESAASRRYSKTRIKRILCANLLKIYADETEAFLGGELPRKILAIKKERADELLPLLAPSAELSAAAKACEQKSTDAYLLWRHLNAPLFFDNPNEKMILV